MFPIAIAVLLVQTPSCSGKSAALVVSAQAHAEAFALSAAADAFEAAAAAGCAEARLPAVYLRGWIAAREAYRFGGSPESLEPVRRALEQMDSLGSQLAGQTEVTRFVLRAANSAAQSERDELSLLIEHAVDLEARRRSAGLAGAPVLTAHEAAGDLWLQVHRYEDAKRAYVRAADRIGRTRRVMLGLARTAVRLGDTRAACVEYQALVGSWTSTGAEPSELAEARAFLRQPACHAV